MQSKLLPRSATTLAVLLVGILLGLPLSSMAQVPAIRVAASSGA